MDSYYDGWRLEINEYEWSNKDKEYMEAACMLVEEKMSIRLVCRELLLYKSSFHRWIHSRLKYISDELYYSVKKQLRYNTKHKSPYYHRKNSGRW